MSVCLQSAVVYVHGMCVFSVSVCSVFLVLGRSVFSVRVQCVCFQFVWVVCVCGGG